MEGAPPKMDVQGLMAKVNKVEFVSEIHDFHVWSISLGKTAMSAHVKCTQNPMKVLKEVTELCKEAGIGHITIQVEEKDSLGDCTQTLHNEIEGV